MQYLILRLKVSCKLTDDRAYAGNFKRRDSEKGWGEWKIEMVPILRGWVGSSNSMWWGCDDGMCRESTRYWLALLWTSVKLVYEVRVCEWMNLTHSLSFLFLNLSLPSLFVTLATKSELHLGHRSHDSLSPSFIFSLFLSFSRPLLVRITWNETEVWVFTSIQLVGLCIRHGTWFKRQDVSVSSLFYYFFLWKIQWQCK